MNQPSPKATSEDIKDALRNSIRQSPPPITDQQSMPKGAVISPPESASSDDDDLLELRGRRTENLKQLHDAISQISQHREASPDKADNATDAGDPLVMPSQTEAIAGVHHSFSASSLEDLARARRVSHNRSMTVPNVPVSRSADSSAASSEEEDEPSRKPQMVRKKSGELVRPALRPASHRRPSSMPGTPTFSKAVHFDSHLEHVRHFLQVDRPLAVSAGSSPVETYDSDTEYPFTSDDKPAPRTPPFEWEIIINNFPVETPARKAQAVRLERVWLSNDHKFLIGSVVVANLAFQKLVTCRFTLDYWKTTSEVIAEYSSEITPRTFPQGHDRFNFSIKLADLANLETKTLYFAIRYTVNGQEHWDNNGGTNFQVDFRKKMLPTNGKRPVGAANRPPNGLPRSNRRSNPSSGPRPKSMPVGFDDFSDNPRVNFDQSIHDYLGEQPTPLRLKSSKSTTNIPSDNLSTRLSAPSGQAFANRYDFGASLSAAMQAAKDSMTKDGLQMKSGRKTSPPSSSNTAKPLSNETQPMAANKYAASANNTLPGLSGAGSPGAASIATSSYEEIVNKYCFFGSKQSSPQLKDGTIGGGRFDGADDLLATRESNSPVSSFNGSPFALGSLQRANGSQLRHFMTSDPNPYFQHSAHLMAVGASPAMSPLGNTIIRTDSPSNGQPRSSTSVLGQSTGRSGSPASMVGGFQPFTGTSPNEFANHLHDRFPFFGPDAHSATAIRGN
ncbi:Protein phosphatase 1 regulatory subunit 3E [Cytospora mali]|uniref:Protein phosphatase 1 regulatory subunit 3E n=1 Tax=Cytospora mali TaxID=578113 RepID=A0A194V617_CYTMA|nr:Protein phosphatase 1 regulatory subunit 3E [Valsa mali var. pyri (nom. inval.)]